MTDTSEPRWLLLIIPYSSTGLIYELVSETEQTLFVRRDEHLSPGPPRRFEKRGATYEIYDTAEAAEEAKDRYRAVWNAHTDAFDEALNALRAAEETRRLAAAAAL